MFVPSIIWPIRYDMSKARYLDVMVDNTEKFRKLPKEVTRWFLEEVLPFFTAAENRENNFQLDKLVKGN